MQCLKAASFSTGLPEKPTITNTEIEVDKDVIVTWSEAEANSSNGNIKYRLEWRKQPVTGSKEMVQRGNIEDTHLKITGLEYDAEYEVRLFAVNEQGDSEPDVKTFKTKSGMFLYLRLLTLLLVELCEMKQNKYCWVLNTGVTQLFIRLRVVKLCDNRLNIYAAALI